MTPTPKMATWFLLTRHWLSLLGLAFIVTAALSSLFMASVWVRATRATLIRESWFFPPSYC